MEIDVSPPWRIFLVDASSPTGFMAPDLLGARIARPHECENPSEFAAAELASSLAMVGGSPILAGTGDEGEETGIIILDPGIVLSPRGGIVEESPKLRNFAWRASGRRIEIHGGSGTGLLAGCYDFLEAAGFAWPSPISAPVIPMAAHAPQLGASLALVRGSGFRRGPFPLPCLILGHGSYLERGADYFLWAARNGYASIFIHTTGEAMALGAAPLSLYEKMRPVLAPMARRLGLGMELGGHSLSSLLPRRLFAKKPGLFRFSGGARKADRNFCPSSREALDIVGANFAAHVDSHPEIGVFHVWPDDLPGGGWCQCPECAGLSPAAQSIKVAAVLGRILSRLRPGAKLSFLAYHDTEDLGTAIEGNDRLPASLELLWAPRLRSWAKGYGDQSSSLNSASLKRLDAAQETYHAAGGSTVSIFEYWEDAVLFKTAVPPLPCVMAKDLDHYARRAGIGRVGILLTGDRLPLAPRPNPWIFPRLLREAAEGVTDPESLMVRWGEAVYGGAAAPMRRYWKALEAAWAIDLDWEEGETALFIPEPRSSCASHPPADWGDPWKTGLARLSARRERCEELFRLLREAEADLEEALAVEALPTESRRCVEAEKKEYAIASGILEANCARIAAWHEVAMGSPRTAADLALIARSILDSVYRAYRAVPDPRARRNGRFLLFLFYELRFRAMARGRSRGILPRIGALQTMAELGLRAASILRLWEP